jgi:hypothetical protein
MSILTSVRMPHALRQLLAGAQPADVGAERVGRRDERVEDAEGARDAQQVPQTDGAGVGREPAHRLVGHAGAVSDLLYGQPAQLAPGDKMLADSARRALDGKWSWCSHQLKATDIGAYLALSPRYVGL